MELTKEQIQYIDRRLENEGVKYWDLRLEMIDHIVSDVELNSKTNNFKKELNNTLKRIGWSGNLSSVNREGWQNVNREYRREYHKGFVSFFKKGINLTILLISMFLFYLISEKISFKNFERLSFTIFALPIIFIIYLGIKTSIKKYGRSINLDYGFTYLIMSFLILNAIPSFFNEQTESIPKLIWFILIPIHLIFTFSGYKVYRKAISRVEKIRKELQL